MTTVVDNPSNFVECLPRSTAKIWLAGNMVRYRRSALVRFLTLARFRAHI